MIQSQLFRAGWNILKAVTFKKGEETLKATAIQNEQPTGNMSHASFFGSIRRFIFFNWWFPAGHPYIRIKDQIIKKIIRAWIRFE